MLSRLTEEVTNGNPWSPDAPTMSIISHAAFEVDDFWRIIDIIHKRFFPQLSLSLSLIYII